MLAIRSVSIIVFNWITFPIFSEQCLWLTFPFWCMIVLLVDILIIVHSYSRWMFSLLFVWLSYCDSSWLPHRQHCVRTCARFTLRLHTLRYHLFCARSDRRSTVWCFINMSLSFWISLPLLRVCARHTRSLHRFRRFRTRTSRFTRTRFCARCRGLRLHARAWTRALRTLPHVRYTDHHDKRRHVRSLSIWTILRRAFLRVLVFVVWMNVWWWTKPDVLLVTTMVERWFLFRCMILFGERWVTLILYTVRRPFCIY